MYNKIMGKAIQIENSRDSLGNDEIIIPKDNRSRHLAPFAKIIAKVQAYKIYREVKSSLKHIQLVKEGKIKPTPIDDFLNEL